MGDFRTWFDHLTLYYWNILSWLQKALLERRKTLPISNNHTDVTYFILVGYVKCNNVCEANLCKAFNNYFTYFSFLPATYCTCLFDKFNNLTLLIFTENSPQKQATLPPPESGVTIRWSMESKEMFESI